MKTKKLIKLLQENDPSGELECHVGGNDIFTVYTEPGYWDGSYDILHRDESNEYYNVIGAERTTKGTKVTIRTLSIEDAIFSDSKLPVKSTMTYVDKDREKAFLKWVEDQRAEADSIKNQVEREHFVRWASEFFEAPKDVSEQFYNDCMNYDDEMPNDLCNFKDEKGGWKSMGSWNDRRESQWERQIAFKDGSFTRIG